MDRTTAAGNVSNLYVDEDQENEIQGTSLVAADRNALQEEIVHVIEGAGLTLSASDLSQLWGALIKGAGSLIDADKLDGQHGSYYQNANNLNAGTINSSRLAAADILALLLTIDGAGTGLDSDKLDGQEGAYYLDAGNLNAGTIPSARLSASALLTLIKTVDGSGSALDADLLDGAHKDTDTTLSGNSDSSVPTERAVRAYITAKEAAIKNAVWPVGSTYIQFPGDSSPSTLGLPGTWANVSSELAGDFIRFEGGAATAFNGGKQDFAIENIVGETTAGNDHSAFPENMTGPFEEGASVNNTGVFSALTTTTRLRFDASNAVKTASETRPVNRTVRKWRRAA